MIPKRIIINIIWQSYYSKIDNRLRYIGVKDFSNELNGKKSLNLIQYLEDDILNYSSTACIRKIVYESLIKSLMEFDILAWISSACNKLGNNINLKNCKNLLHLLLECLLHNCIEPKRTQDFILNLLEQIYEEKLEPNLILS